MHRRGIPPLGRVERLAVDGPSLAGALLDEPTTRTVDVYIPGDDPAVAEGAPLLVCLAAYTNSGLGQTNWRAFGENLPERLDRLIGAGLLPPVVVAFPDGCTRLGGNQYVNSPILGRWEDFLAEDLLPAVEQRYGCGGLGRRGLFGKSSGGYGALVQALRRPEVWAAAACHSGDMAFELCYLPDMPATLRALARHQGAIDRFLEAFEAQEKPSGSDIQALMILAMAASYDPAPPDEAAPLGLRLPVDADTCQLDPERWAAWLAWDPVRMVAALTEARADAVRQLRCLYIDCGDADEYNLLYGARRLHRALSDREIPHRYAEFPGTHSRIDHRLDESLPLLARALSAPPEPSPLPVHKHG